MLDLIVLYTDRLDACHAFYSGLGLTFQKEQHGSGPEHFSTTLGSVVFELYPAGEKPPTGRLRIGLTLPPGSGVEPGRHTLTDPDGRTVALTVTGRPPSR
ncbi:guanosine polyphosphate pyrophosphohydrolase [Herbidospora mongoliensis]|uniref:guanosine polyphosphate pyrophosphohydrolase n=1 Tax=Herbidospora mongoliensis TaxID=688067 RepID=UPI00082ABEFD|nr:guanosine polyphosphate pyrophosphohydrolase [Herbidospora mongoliensis]